MLFLQNCVIADGTGGELYKGGLLLDGGRIAEIVREGEKAPSGCEVMDLGGLTIAPGFVDAHSHFEAVILKNPRCKSLLAQGVTTLVCGNCGFFHALSGSAGEYSWKNFKEYIEVFDKVRPNVNAVLLAGHNTLRLAVMGDENRTPTQEEMEKMKSLLQEVLALGAGGLTFGLTYIPGKFSKTEELIELASCLKGTGKLVAAHMRSEGDTLDEALLEMFRVAKSAEVPFHVSHIKTIFQRNFHKLPRMLELLKQAEEEGIRITADRYPYIYSSTTLRQTLPSPYDLMTDSEVKKFLSCEKDFALLEKAMEKSPRDLPTTIILFGKYVGKTIKEISSLTGESVERVCCRLLKEAPHGRVAYLCMSEENMVELIKKPFVSCGSDGLSMSLDDPSELAHPRAVGSLPRFFRIAADLLGVAEAVRKCAALPTEIFRIPERGYIKKGLIADLVVMDPGKVESKADFLGNELLPYGIEKVFLGGEMVYERASLEGVTLTGKGKYLPIQ